MTRSLVGIYQDGELEWHIPHVSGPDYDTACGIDGNDSAFGTELCKTPPPPRQKVTCRQCYALWAGLAEIRVSRYDFADEAKR